MLGTLLLILLILLNVLMLLLMFRYPHIRKWGWGLNDLLEWCLLAVAIMALANTP